MCKVQIRKNVFETNSSTQHTVTICSDKTNYSDYIGKTIILGKDVDYDDLLLSRNKRNPIIKLNQLWLSILSSDTSLYKFMTETMFLKETFKKIGINVEVSVDPEDYRWADEHRWDIDDLSCTIEWVFNSEEDIINYVFNQDSWYDSYEDSYSECPYENDIKQGNKTEWYRNG